MGRYLNKKTQPHFENPIVTEISKLTTFFEAEEGHQDYYKNNSEYGYCTAVIAPKLIQFRNQYRDRLKADKI